MCPLCLQGLAPTDPMHPPVDQRSVGALTFSTSPVYPTRKGAPILCETTLGLIHRPIVDPSSDFRAVGNPRLPFGSPKPLSPISSAAGEWARGGVCQSRHNLLNSFGQNLCPQAG